MVGNGTCGPALPVQLEAARVSGVTKGKCPMSAEENKAVVRRITEEVINKGNFAVAEALVAEDWRPIDPAPGQEPGRKGLIAGVVSLRTAFPDLEMTFEDLVAEGDKVASCGVMRGTHLGPFQGIPLTGKRVTVRGMGLDIVVAGQCKETRVLLDTLSLLRQLGVIPAPGEHSPATA
jgi:steroid delta-isomerase-like uncharacterized protein